MFEIMEESSGNIIGFSAIGIIRKADYEELVPAFEKLIAREGRVRVLMDMKEFRSEAPDAWMADLHFGREFHEKIEKMAMVGDKHWEEWLTRFCAPFYAMEAKFFHTSDIGKAWIWLKE